MVNLNLTNNEWYVLHYQIEELSKQYPSNITPVQGTNE